MLPIYVAISLAIVCFILYALDRRSKDEPIDWFTALKISILGGAMTGGVAFAMTSTDIITALPDLAPVQEMFVGVPAF